jgi:hypothetical protein
VNNVRPPDDNRSFVCLGFVRVLQERRRIMHSPRLAVTLIVLLAGSAAAAQEQRGSIDGIVRDASGGVLPGVTIEAKNVATGAVLTAVTDAAGRFRLPTVQTGTYHHPLEQRQRLGCDYFDHGKARVAVFRRQ